LLMKLHIAARGSVVLTANDSVATTVV